MPVKKEKQFTLGGNPVLVRPSSHEGCVELTAGPYECKVMVGLDKKVNFSVRKGISSLNDTEWFAEGYNGRVSFHARRMGVYWRSVDIELVLKNGVAYPRIFNTSLPYLQGKANELRRAGIPLDENGCMSMEKTLSTLTALERRKLRLPRHLAHDPQILQIEETMRSIIKVRDCAEEAARLEADIERIKEKQPEVVAFIRKNAMPSLI